MKINLPKTVRFLPFQEYDPENSALAGVGIYVWVDPPRAVLQEHNRINRTFTEALKTTTGKPEKKLSIIDLVFRRQKLSGTEPVQAYHQEITAWYAHLWSQGPAETQWTAEEIREIDEHNPAFLEYLYRRSWALIDEHRDQIKKGWRQQEGKQPATGGQTIPS